MCTCVGNKLQELKTYIHTNTLTHLLEQNYVTFECKRMCETEIEQCNIKYIKSDTCLHIQPTVAWKQTKNYKIHIFFNLHNFLTYFVQIIYIFQVYIFLSHCTLSYSNSNINIDCILRQDYTKLQHHKCPSWSLKK